MSWTLDAGDALAHYRVVSPLGSGGMAQVYLAEETRLGRRLALKVLSPRGARDDERLQRFQREARAVSALNHPNILTVYDVAHDRGMQFLATEYVDGVTLRAVLERGALDLAQALTIAIQIARAVAAAHGAGVIHRDLKPENVMIRTDGYVKVLDFGLAKLAGREPGAMGPDDETQLIETRDGVVLGTFKYMAPEQARGTDVDSRADLFAMGVLLYEMLTGEPPFTGGTPADIIGAVLLREPAALGPAVPAELQRIVMTALRKDRTERHQSCALLLQDLTAFERGAPRPATPPGWPALRRRSPRPVTPRTARCRATPSARCRRRRVTRGGAGRGSSKRSPSCRCPIRTAIRSSSTSATG